MPNSLSDVAYFAGKSLAAPSPFKPVSLGKDGQGKQIQLTYEHFKRHMHMLGLSGRGKTYAIIHILKQFLINGTGFTLVDPDGEIYGGLLWWLSRQGESLFRRRAIHLFDVASPTVAPGYNPLRVRPGELVEDRVNCFLRAAAQMVQDQNLEVMQQYKVLFRAVMTSLAERGLTPLEATLVIPEAEGELRRQLGAGAGNPVVAAAWRDIAKWNDRQYHERAGSFRARVSDMLYHPTLQHVLGQTRDTLDVLEVMDRGQVLLVNLAGVDDSVAQIIGRALINDFVHTARKWRVPDKARPHIMVIDECAPLLSDDVAFGLDRDRKYGVHLVLSHQRLEQLVKVSPDICSAVMDGAQCKIFFASSYKTGVVIADEIFGPSYDLERPKGPEMPVVVGHKKEITRGGAEGLARHWADTRTSSRGRATGRSRVEMEGEQEAFGRSHTESDTVGEAEGGNASWGASDGTATNTGSFDGAGLSSGVSFGYDDPGTMGAPLRMPDSMTASSGQSAMRGASAGSAASHNETSGGGTSWSRSRQHGVSDAESRSFGTSRVSGTVESEVESEMDAHGRMDGATASRSSSWQETYTPDIRWMRTQTFGLEDERHRHAVMLQTLGVQRFVLREPVGNRLTSGLTAGVRLDEPRADALDRLTRRLLGATNLNKDKLLVQREIDQRALALRRSVGPQVVPPPKASVRDLRDGQAEGKDPMAEPEDWYSD